MTVDQVILAAKLWRHKLHTAAIAERLGLPESVIHNNLWRIRAVAKPHRRQA